jgi:hypothetical protein
MDYKARIDYQPPAITPLFVESKGDWKPTPIWPYVFAFMISAPPIAILFTAWVLFPLFKMLGIL